MPLIKNDVGGSIVSRLIPGIMIIIFALSGCAQLPVAPYRTYVETTQKAQNAIDQALAHAYAWTRSGFVENYQGSFSDLIIQPGTGYEWSLPSPPLFLSVKKARRTLSLLNQAFVEYTLLLEQLASGRYSDPGEYERLSQELNDNVQQAWKTFAGRESQADIALFSVAGMELMRMYGQGKQSAAIQKIIAENQKTVEAYAGHCLELTHLLRGALKTYYVEKYQPIWKRWQKTPSTARQTAVADMLDLNDQFTDSLLLLEEIEGVYRQLPKAHADLVLPAKAVAPTLDRQGLKQLLEAGQRLERIHREIKQKE
ncbi:hypothetical protein JW933_11470 [candidate division FCPU426 bacterium]|nr:hypothetical protein [candidate division FCPU426 bacterium]